MQHPNHDFLSALYGRFTSVSDAAHCLGISRSLACRYRLGQIPISRPVANQLRILNLITPDQAADIIITLRQTGSEPTENNPFAEPERVVTKKTAF